MNVLFKENILAWIIAVSLVAVLVAIGLAIGCEFDDTICCLCQLNVNI